MCFQCSARLVWLPQASSGDINKAEFSLWFFIFILLQLNTKLVHPSAEKQTDRQPNAAKGNALLLNWALFLVLSIHFVACLQSGTISILQFLRSPPPFSFYSIWLNKCAARTKLPAHFSRLPACLLGRYLMQIQRRRRRRRSCKFCLILELTQWAYNFAKQLAFLATTKLISRSKCNVASQPDSGSVFNAPSNDYKRKDLIIAFWPTQPAQWSLSFWLWRRGIYKFLLFVWV